KIRSGTLSLYSDKGRSSLDIRLRRRPVLSYDRRAPNSHFVDPQVSGTEVGEMSAQACALLDALWCKVQIHAVGCSPVVVGMKAQPGLLIFDGFGSVLLNSVVITSAHE